MRKHISKKTAAVAAVLTLGTGAAAFAYWTQTGSGTGSAATGTTTAITVVQDSTPAGLYPGGPSGALSGHFVNPNSGGVEIVSVTAVVSSVSNGTSDSTKPACTPADYAIGGTTGGYLVAPGAGTTWSGLTISLLNTADNQDNCKNATANIAYTANP